MTATPRPPPTSPRFAARDVQVNGVRIRVRTAGEGDRLALLLHGFPETWFSWRAQMPLLAELGYQVWAPDLRGYGDSERPDGIAAYRMETLVDDVAGLVDVSGARELVLVGHDWGGAIAWQMARRRIRTVDRLIVLNMAHPAVFGRHLRGFGRQRLRSAYMVLFQLPWLPEQILSLGNQRALRWALEAAVADRARFPPEVVEVYRAAAAAPGALTAMLNYYRAAFRHPYVMKAQPGEIETPTLMIWGEADPALGKELTHGTDRYVRDLTLRYLPRVGHFVHEEAPREVNALLRAWLQGGPTPEAWEIRTS